MPEIFVIIEKEIQLPKQPTSSKYIITTEVLTCIKMMLKNFGDEFEKRTDLV